MSFRLFAWVALLVVVSGCASEPPPPTPLTGTATPLVTLPLPPVTTVTPSGWVTWEADHPTPTPAAPDLLDKDLASQPAHEWERTARAMPAFVFDQVGQISFTSHYGLRRAAALTRPSSLENDADVLLFLQANRFLLHTQGISRHGLALFNRWTIGPFDLPFNYLALRAELSGRTGSAEYLVLDVAYDPDKAREALTQQGFAADQRGAIPVFVHVGDAGELVDFGWNRLSAIALLPDDLILAASSTADLDAALAALDAHQTLDTRSDVARLLDADTPIESLYLDRSVPASELDKYVLPLSGERVRADLCDAPLHYSAWSLLRHDNRAEFRFLYPDATAAQAEVPTLQERLVSARSIRFPNAPRWGELAGLGPLATIEDGSLVRLQATIRNPKRPPPRAPR